MKKQKDISHSCADIRPLDSRFRKNDIRISRLMDSGLRRNDIGVQSGRSMVEMLGTLAIMGVLTIWGIAGYRYDINKSNANTILVAVSQMAVTAITELT
ncbi:MAG: hypothetical protein IJV07_02585, partial [Alphaproteobacteria bacterium]|nr:hypothetical protein [Alphaproteobacteria bacterium]